MRASSNTPRACLGCHGENQNCSSSHRKAQIKCSGTSLGPQGCVKAAFAVPPCTHRLYVRQAAATLRYIFMSI